MIVNSTLGYMLNCHRKCAKGNIKMIVETFYSKVEISEAKKALYDAKSDILGECPKRCNSELRTAHQKDIEDIFNAIRILDAQDKLPDIVVRDLDRVPDRSPEEINMLFYLTRVDDLEKKSIQQMKVIEMLSLEMMAVKRTLYKTDNNDDSSLCTGDSFKIN